MKTVILSLFCLCLAGLSLEAQERPAKYFTSTLSRYDYRGVTIEKGDQLQFKDGRRVTVKEIQNYKINYGPRYYINGTDAQGKEVWYSVTAAIDKGDLVLPEGTVLVDKVTYGILPEINGKIIYEHIGEMPGLPKDKLFDRALSQLARMISNNEEAINVQFSDKEEGHIMAQAGFSLSYGRLLAMDGMKELRVTYVLDIRIKDGRYKLNLDNFAAQICSVNGKWTAYPASMYTISNSQLQRDKEATMQFDAHNRGLMQRFAQALQASADADTW